MRKAPMPANVASIAAAILAVLLALRPALQAASAPRADRHVILVSIDGLAAFYFDDPRADMPTLRRLAREGARAKVRSVFPSVTWPAHTTISTGASPGRHGVIANAYFDRSSGEKVVLLCDPVYDKDAVVKVPTIYDAVHAAGLEAAGVLWPATRSARTLDPTVPDMPGDGWERFGTKAWLDALRAEGIPVDRHAAWCKEAAGGVQRDWLYVRMARHALRTRAPHLILIHLVEPDHVQHRHGPRSPEAWWCASYSDDRIADLLAEAQRPPLAGKTWLFIVSDHGFLPVRRTIQPNTLLAKLGLVELEKPKEEKPAKADAAAKTAEPQLGRRAAWCLSEGGAASVYILDASRRTEILARLKPALAALEGVDSVLEPAEFGRLGQPAPSEDPRAPDLWLAAREGYAFGESAVAKEVVADKDPPGGTHGYLPDPPDMQALLVAWGPGIEPGTDLGRIDLKDIAPTIARILGVEMPAAEGRAIEAIPEKKDWKNGNGKF